MRDAQHVVAGGGEPAEHRRERLGAHTLGPADAPRVQQRVEIAVLAHERLRRARRRRPRRSWGTRLDAELARLVAGQAGAGVDYEREHMRLHPHRSGTLRSVCSSQLCAAQAPRARRAWRAGAPRAARRPRCVPPPSPSSTTRVDDAQAQQVLGGEARAPRRPRRPWRRPCRGCSAHPSGLMTEYTAFSSIHTRSATPSAECAAAAALADHDAHDGRL